MQGALFAGGGGLVSAYGQYQANQTNKDIANNQINFQREMSNTAYQRSMADMKAAGLNPMLAATIGGASTPPGASTTVENTLASAQNVPNNASQMNKNAVEVKNLTQQLNNLKQEEKTQSALEINHKAEALKNQAQAQESLQNAKSSQLSQNILKPDSLKADLETEMLQNKYYAMGVQARKGIETLMPDVMKHGKKSIIPNYLERYKSRKISK